MKILFVYPRARNKFYENYQKQQSASSIFYGAMEMQEAGHKIVYSDRAFSRANILFWLWYPFQKFFIKYTGIGFKLDQALLLLPEILSADLIITTCDSAGMPIALLKRLGIVKTPLIYTSIGLAGQQKRLGSNWAFSLAKFVLPGADKIVCYTQIEKKLLSKNFAIPDRKLTYFPWCMDTNFFHPSPRKKTGDFVLAVGQGYGRDYPLLLQAATKLPDISFRILCTPKTLAGLKIPKNVTTEFVDYITLRQRYWDASLVALPLIETQRASGQMAILEAMACAKPVIVSKVRGLTEVYDLISEKNCLLIEPNEQTQLISQIKRLWNNPGIAKKLGNEGRNLVMKKYSQDVYSRFLLREFKKLAS